MSIPEILILVLAGVGGGIISGMLGIGGGMIYVLIFSHFFHSVTKSELPGDVQVRLLIANAVFAIIFVGLAGSIKQYLSNNFHLKPILWIGLPGIAGAIFTTYLLSITDFYAKKEFAVFFSILLIPIILKMIFQEKFKNRGQIKPKRTGYLIATGAIGGIVTALSGLGGGFIVIPILNGLLRIPFKKSVSISLGVIALVAFGLSIYNLLAVNYTAYAIPMSIGGIIFPLVLPVIAGVLIGAPIGVRVSQIVSNRFLRITFVVFCLFVISKIYYDFL